MQPATDFTIPTTDLRSLARRAALPAALAGIAAAGILVAGGPARAFAHALRRAVDADPAWVAAAAGFEVVSFAGYVALLWLVAGRATRRMGARESMEVTLGGAAATRLLPTAGVGGAALTLWALRRSGLGARDAGRTLLTFLVLLYSVFLGAIAVSGTLLTVHGDGPKALTAVPAAAAALGIAIPLALGLRRPAPNGYAPRLRSGARLLGDAVADALVLVRRGDVRLLGALAWWGFDAAVLVAMLHAFGAAPSFAVIAFAYFAGQAGNTVPVPGAVSGGIVGVLLAFGVEPDTAIVSVLGYRSVAIWLPAPIGLAALRSLRATIARWAHEDVRRHNEEGAVVRRHPARDRATAAGRRTRRLGAARRAGAAISRAA